MSRSLATLPSLLLLGTALSFPALAFAQDTSAGKVEEVVVTATRRSQTVQEVPYNISAYSGAALEESGVVDFSNLSHFVPGLAFVDTGPAVMGNNNNFILRGLNANQTINGGGNPNAAVAPVSTYLGEAPVFFPMHLSDLQRVEVLRGPQGTLYGSGSLGGTLRFIPNPPELDAFYAKATGEVSSTAHSGSLNENGEVVVNLPLVTDKLGLRVVAGINHLAGFIDAPNFVALDANGVPVPGVAGDPASGFTVRPNQKDINGSTTNYVRTELRAVLAPGWEAQVNYMHQYDAVKNPQTINGGFAGGNIDSSGADFPGSIFPNVAGIPGGGFWPNGGTVFPATHGYETGAYINQPYHREVDIADLDISGDLGFATVTSTTSYYNNTEDQRTDLTGSYEVSAAPGTSNFAYFYGYYPRMLIEDPAHYKNSGWSQEIRLASQGTRTVDYVVGGFYSHQKSSGTDALVTPGLNDFDQTVLPLLGGPFGQNPGEPDITMTRNRGYVFNDHALFGELTWHVTPAWQITGGVRYFWQDFKVNYSQTQPFCGALCAQDLTDPLGTTTVPANTSKVHDAIFKLNTSYDIDEDLKFYATFSQGFRRGGANGVGTGGVYASLPQFLTYDPDKSNNYEIGAKGSYLGQTFTLAGFYIDWDHFQFDDFTPSQFGEVINGSKAHSAGIELELSGALAEGLNYTFGYSYTEAQIDKSFSVADLPPYALIYGLPPVTNIVGFKGDSLPGVSKHQLSGTLDYIVPVGSRGWSIDFHLNGSYRSSANSAFNRVTQFGKTFYKIEGFSIFDASITLDSNAAWSLTAFVDNIGDEKGVTGGLPAPVMGAQQQYYFVTPPRTFGLRATYQTE
jgi:outer membrane receptor protein involved in Fe transport